MKVTKAALIFSLSAILIGCGAPKLDSSSEEAYKASLAEITSSLGSEDQAKLKKALGKIAFSRIMSSAGQGEAGVDGFRQAVHGKTATELFEMAEQ